MHTLCLFLLLTLIQLVCFGQSVSPIDTTVDADTIYEKRTVERVVYVYAAPETYLSVGVRAAVSQPFFTGITSEKTDGLAYSGEAVLQYQRGKWLYLAGIGIQSFSRTERYSKEHYFTIPSTYEKIDTISWYLVETPEGLQCEYVTESRIADTLLVASETIHSQASPHYTYLHVPLSIGRQLRHGFFCIDASAGIRPGILVQHSKQVNGYVTRDQLKPESVLLNRFTCDVQASLSFRYLLTFTTFISADIFCSVPLVPMYQSIADKPLRKYEAGVRATFSYILFEGE